PITSIVATESRPSCAISVSRETSPSVLLSTSYTAALNIWMISSSVCSFISPGSLDSVDAAKRPLRQRLIVLVEAPHAGGEIAVVVLEDLAPPPVANERFVFAQPIAPVPARLAVVLASRLHLHDLPIRIHGHHDIFHARRDPAREDRVRH